MLVLQITGTVDLEVSVILPRLACSTWFPRPECRVFFLINKNKVAAYIADSVESFSRAGFCAFLD